MCDDEFFEPVGAAFPDGALLRKPAIEHGKPLFLQRAEPDTPLLARHDQPRLLQLADMLHEGWQGHIEGFGQRSNARLAAAEPQDHGPAGGIGERLEDVIERFRIVFHKANYHDKTLSSMDKFKIS